MDCYIYQAALYCAPCGEKIRGELTAAGRAPEDPDDERSFDSDDFPKGPYGDGGGEADTPQHCDACQGFLENPLTDDGRVYVCAEVADAIVGVLRGTREPIAASSVLGTWAVYYEIQLAVSCGDTSADARIDATEGEITRPDDEATVAIG